MSARGVDPDDGRHYGDLVERAVAEGARAVEAASSLGRHGAGVVAQVRAANANTASNLAIAERLDVLIGSLFDEQCAIRVVEVEPEDEPEHDEDEESGVHLPAVGQVMCANCGWDASFQPPEVISQGCTRCGGLLVEGKGGDPEVQS